MNKIMKKIEFSETFLPFFISFSFLKTLPVSAVTKASPFSHRLRTDTPGLAASMRVFKASDKKDFKQNNKVSDPKNCNLV